MTQKLEEVELFAWVGEDELGSGEIGLKQGVTPVGIIPLVGIDESKMARFTSQLQQQANNYGKTIKLCRYVLAETIATLEPRR